jgi:hypothetical protein
MSGCASVIRIAVNFPATDLYLHKMSIKVAEGRIAENALENMFTPNWYVFPLT